MAISGEIIKPGDVVNITYSGGIQTWEVPKDGLYKIEAWGARGGNVTCYADGKSGSATGGYGGYSIGYIVLIKGTVLYIVCGGAGTDDTDAPGYNYFPRNRTGGYNGGGRGYSGGMNVKGSGGGGATHIALVTGLLSSLSGKLDLILLIAGGGGGASRRFNTIDQLMIAANGGTGGGPSGGDGFSYIYNKAVSNTGGTQNAGNAFGQGGNYPAEAFCSGGAGSGLYGGKATDESSGGGGSGYIEGVPEIDFDGQIYKPDTKNGVNAGNGFAKITFIAEFSKHSAYVGDVPVMFYLGDMEFDPFA